jgi:hypothetical protein
MSLLRRRKLSRRAVAVFAGVLLLCVPQLRAPNSSAQTRNRHQERQGASSAPAAGPRWEEHDVIERAAASICEERLRDRQGSVPIDQMAAQRPLPLTNPSVTAGRKRAERLLPVARRLVPSALSRLAADYNLEAVNLNWINERVKTVSVIKAEVEAHDNAYWRPSDPNAIIFGTNFLAGVRSDEAMITVLAHELTHAVDGTDRSLQPLFTRVEARASKVSRLRINERIAAELTCEAVGLQAMRAHTGKASRKVEVKRLARAMGKNCVRLDLADANHLSPRETLRVLLALEPELAMAVTVTEGKSRQPKSRK